MAKRQNTDRAALIYCRVSTRGQEQDGTSLESQEAACVKQALSLGYTVGRVTKEVYSGAELWDRPLLSRDRADLRKGAFAALITYATDRLARDPIHLAIIAQECEQMGVELIFVTEPLDNSDEGQLVRYIKGYSNKLEREKIRERSLRGKRHRALSGKVHTEGLDKYGYGRDKEAGVRTIKESEAIVVRRIYQMIAHEGHSFRSASRALDQLGVHTPGYERTLARDPERAATLHWDSTTVERIIRNPLYKGETWEWMYQRQLSPKDRARPDIDPARKKDKRPHEDWIKLPDGVTPAIVSAQLWQEAQDAVRKQNGERTRNETWEYLLRGRIFCAVCGRKMWPNWRRKKTSDPTSEKIRTYRCSSYQLAPGQCKGRTVRAEDIEAWVWEQIRSALTHPEWLADELERRREEVNEGALVSDLEIARKEVAKCAKQQERLIQRFTASEDESLWEVVEREIMRLGREKTRWAETVAELEERLSQQNLPLQHLAVLKAYCARTANELDSFDFEKKCLTLEALRIRVTASGTAWRLNGSIPLDEPPPDNPPGGGGDGAPPPTRLAKRIQDAPTIEVVARHTSSC